LLDERIQLHKQFYVDKANQYTNSTIQDFFLAIAPQNANMNYLHYTNDDTSINPTADGGSDESYGSASDTIRGIRI
jgi:hypothetical protein